MSIVIPEAMLAKPAAGAWPWDLIAKVQNEFCEKIERVSEIWEGELGARMQDGSRVLS